MEKHDVSTPMSNIAQTGHSSLPNVGCLTILLIARLTLECCGFVFD
jgi:hypothetical protein